MCHFHSVIVTNDGRILHHESNSHSTIARRHNLPPGIDAPWFECEWDGKGDMPVDLVQTRGKSTPVSGIAQRAAERHYEKLAKIMAGELDPRDTEPFDAPEYVDVRIAYDSAAHTRKLQPIVDLLDDLDGSYEELIKALVEMTGADIDEIADERIQELEKEKEAEFDRGFEAASEDMYSWEYMQEEIESAVEKAKEEWEGELDAAYSNGYIDCRAGRAPSVELERYTNGMPSFLF